jgi:polyhydroxyalkanoate synthesis regulator phasin
MGMHQPVESFNTIDPQKMTQAVFNLTKDYTTNTMQIMKTSMEQVEKIVGTILKQDMVIHKDEAQKLFYDWMNQAKQGQKQYCNIMDVNLKKMETFFNSEKRTEC